MEGFPSYKNYKDSGVPWLGQIPDHWEIQTIRAVTELKSEKNQPDLPVLSVYREYGVIPKDSRDDNHNATSLDTSSYKAVDVGDLVINKMKAWQGSMGVSTHQGIVSPAYITCRINAKKIVPGFLHHLLRSKLYIGVYNSLSYGVRVGQWDMHYEDFKKILIPLPEVGEQQRIATFLDQKTAEIDEAIDKKQRLIELLKEQKAILINQAVTKGLNPNVPMRDSGVEWIGEIPRHWHIVPLKRLVDVRDGTHETPDYVEPSQYSFPLVTSKDFEQDSIRFESAKHIAARDHKEIIKRSKVAIGDVLMSMIGGNIGKALIVKIEKEFSIKNVALFKTSKNRDLTKYLLYYLISGLLDEQIALKSRGGAQGFLSLNDIRNLIFFKIPPGEYSKIVEYLDRGVDMIDGLISGQEASITRLKEFSALIIGQAVTGKIKV